MKFLLAFTLLRDGISARTGGSWMQELEAMLIVSRTVQAANSEGKVEIRLLDTSRSVMSVKLMASLGGTLDMRLPERLQARRGTSRIRWKMASGTWTSWHSERSSLPPSSLAWLHPCTILAHSPC